MSREPRNRFRAPGDLRQRVHCLARYLDIFDTPFLFLSHIYHTLYLTVGSFHTRTFSSSKSPKYTADIALTGHTSLAMSVPLGDNPAARHPDPIVDGVADTQPNPSTGNIIREELNHEGATINSGLPFPSAIGNANVIPNLDTVSAQTLNEKPPQATSSRNASDSHEKPLAPTSTNSSTKEKITPQSEVKAKKGFFGRKSKKDEEDKKDKQKEEEADAVPPVSFFGLYRYATWYEKILNIIGIIFACAAGAAQPLMTLIFGRLTQSFNEFGQTATAIAEGRAPFSALADAQARLKTDSGHNALYLLAIGVGMFLTTWLYMYIWSVTGELNSKRIREKYLASVLRQEVSSIFSIIFDIFRKMLISRLLSSMTLVQERSLRVSRTIVI